MKSDHGTGGQTAHEFARATLRHAILTGQIPAGSRLVQTDLAAQLSLSTTPVREALRDLATEGLIRFDAHRGAVVHRLTQREVEEIYRIRRLLEPEIIRRAAERITAAQLNEAERVQRAADSETDAAKWSDLNLRFHAIFSEAADSPRLGTMVGGLQDTAAPYVLASFLHGRQRQTGGPSAHWQLLEAIRDRDAERAVRITVDHIHATYEAVVAATNFSQFAPLSLNPS
jgi:DNA-binding GntR family transcriptional regulator